MSSSLFDRQNFKAYFADYVKERLLQLQMSLDTLAEKSHVSNKTLKRYLYGDINKSPKIRPNTYHKILAALDSSHDDFSRYFDEQDVPQAIATEKPRLYYRILPVVVLLVVVITTLTLHQPQALVIRGIVLDDANNPVKDASISLSGFAVGTFSKTNGEFSIPLNGIKQGKVASILVSHPNYQSLWYDHLIKEEGNKKVVLSMVPQ